MGRLFWKFFFFVWLAQLTTITGVSGIFWLERQQAMAEGRFPEHRPPPPPELRGGEPGRPPGPGRHPPPPHVRGSPIPVVPLLAALVASLAFAALLARYFSQPIRTLRSAFEAAATGNLDLRLSAAMGGRRDELADLGRDFDRMAGQLKSLMEGQRRLLHDVSHELRSPLARLQAAVDLARQQPARQESSMARIERESVRMDRLVGELLTLSRLEAGVKGPQDDIEVAELLAAIVEDARFEANPRQVLVDMAGSGDGLVVGDGELLHRAVENVVRNGVKHTPAGGRVTVEAVVDAAAGEVRILVSDTGPGIPDDELPHIFEPFYRGNRPKDSDGHGLGLAIARRVVEALGGRIAGRNRAEGGLCMEICLPVLPLPRPGSAL